MEDFYAGLSLITCFCTSLILDSNYFDVPQKYKALLGSSAIFLQPGTCKKQKNREKVNQIFVFEITSGKDLKANEDFFFV